MDRKLLRSTFGMRKIASCLMMAAMFLLHVYGSDDGDPAGYYASLFEGGMSGIMFVDHNLWRQ